MNSGTLLKLMRPRQWTKNVIVLAPPLFGGVLFDQSVLFQVAVTFVSFCLCSSAVYVLNDVIDCERDRLHPRKCNRPIASGKVSRGTALSFSLLLAMASVVLTLMLPPTVAWQLAGLLSLYWLLMAGYCYRFKNIAVLDILIIAAGFVLRAVAGAAAAEVPPSGWFLLCTTFGALFISLEKRLQESKTMDAAAAEHRPAMQAYTRPVLERLESAVVASLIMSYALYAFHSPHGQVMLITIPFVIYGVMRYQLISVDSRLTETPEEVFLKDKQLRATIGLWALVCIAVIYHFQLGSQLAALHGQPIAAEHITVTH
jgi:4-hydroxybenzoate polyprenyltransferase